MNGDDLARKSFRARLKITNVKAMLNKKRPTQTFALAFMEARAGRQKNA
jgi:hypothetical protein